MKPQVPWLRVFVEGVVIVGSILLAFGIDAAWEGRQERERLEASLAGLRAEFVAIGDEVDDFLVYYRGREEATVELLELLGPSPAPLALDSLQVLAWNSVRTATLDVPAGALEFFVATGDVHLIEGSELGELLAAWNGMVTDTREQTTWLRREYDELIEPIINRHLPLRDVIGGLRAVVSRSRFPSDPQALLRDSELEGLLASRLAVVQVLINELLGMSEAATAIVNLIDRELAP